MKSTKWRAQGAGVKVPDRMSPIDEVAANEALKCFPSGAREVTS